MLIVFIIHIQVIQRPLTTLNNLRAISGANPGRCPLFLEKYRCGVHPGNSNLSSKSLLVSDPQRTIGEDDLFISIHVCITFLVLALSVFASHPEKKDFWINIMSSLISGLGRHSPRLEAIELNPMSPRVSELALRGLPLLLTVVLTSLTHKTLLCLSHLAGIEDLGIIIPALLGSVQTSISYPVQAVYRPSIGNVIEGWVMPCMQLVLVHDIPATAFAIEHTLRKLDLTTIYSATTCVPFTYASIRAIMVITLITHSDCAHSLPLCVSVILEVFILHHTVCRCLMAMISSSNAGHVSRIFVLEPGISGRHDRKSLFRALCLSSLFASISRSLGWCLTLQCQVRLWLRSKQGGGTCNTNITKLDVGSSPISCAVSDLAMLDGSGLRYANGWAEKALRSSNVYTLIRKQEGLHVPWTLEDQQEECVLLCPVLNALLSAFSSIEWGNIE